MTGHLGNHISYLSNTSLSTSYLIGLILTWRFGWSHLEVGDGDDGGDDGGAP